MLSIRSMNHCIASLCVTLLSTIKYFNKDSSQLWHSAHRRGPRPCSRTQQYLLPLCSVFKCSPKGAFGRLFSTCHFKVPFRDLQGSLHDKSEPKATESAAQGGRSQSKPTSSPPAGHYLRHEMHDRVRCRSVGEADIGFASSFPCWNGWDAEAAPDTAYVNNVDSCMHAIDMHEAWV